MGNVTLVLNSMTAYVQRQLEGMSTCYKQAREVNMQHNVSNIIFYHVLPFRSESMPD